jgi:hypothetical protein
MHGYFQSWHIASLRCDATISLLSARLRFDRIETGLWIADLTRFPDANRYPPPDQVRGHASLENAPGKSGSGADIVKPTRLTRFGHEHGRTLAHKSAI